MNKKMKIVVVVVLALLVAVGLLMARNTGEYKGLIKLPNTETVNK